MPLKVIISGKEMFNPKTNQFFDSPNIEFTIEHSLAAIKKWESKWHIHFIGNQNKTPEQILDYIKCMTITPDVPDTAYQKLTKQNFKEIHDYMDDPMTATTFKKRKKKKNELVSGGFITNEIVYWWMTELNIPQEYQYWHINQLMTLIQVINIKHEEAEEKSKNKGKTKNSSVDIDERRRLNEERRKQHNSKG